MKNKVLKLCLIALISTCSVFCIREIAQACAGGDFEYDAAGYSLFSQKLIGGSVFAPFLYEPSQPYFAGLMDSSGMKPFSSNEEEWVAYLGKVAKTGEVMELVSKSKLADLTELKNAVQKKANALSTGFLKNAAIQYLIQKGDVETCNYLLFAKRCEPHSTASQDDWGSLPVRDSVAMVKLCSEGEAGASAAGNSFLRNRYAFQAARMAHYGNRYKECLQVCQKYLAGVPADSYISRRFQALQAGAFKHLERYAEARYRFAMMFDKYYSEDFDFYYKNFAFSTPLNWNKQAAISNSGGGPDYTDSLSGYQYCRNRHEKAVLCFLDAYSGTVLELPAMRAMYNYEPGSELLDILLVRTLTETEKGGYFPKGVSINPV
jgi:hypothetical protein